MKKKHFLYFVPILFVLVFITFNEKESHDLGGGSEFKQSEQSNRKVAASINNLEVESQETVTRKPAQVARQIPQDMKDLFALRNKKQKGEVPKPEARNISGEYLQGPYQRAYQFLNKTRAFKLSKEIIELYPNGHQHLGFWIAEDNGAREEGLDVVYNDQRNSYAVLTGVLKIMYKDSRDAEHFRGETEGFEQESYPHISSVLYKYQDKAFLFKAQKLCLENPSLEICEVEMLEHDRGSR